jgi:hypothetical protein
MKNFVFIALVSLVTVFSCKPAKKIQTVVTRKDTAVLTPPIVKVPVDSNVLRKEIFQKINSNRIAFEYFFGKIKIDYNDSKGKNVNATAFVRMKKDSVIWVSLTGALGIEGYRVIVKPNEVVVMDKLEKTISNKSMSYLQDLIKLPVDFYTVQDLLLGNPVFFNDSIVSFRKSGTSLLALSIGDFFKHLITIDTTDNRILHSKLDDVEANRNRTCDISLGDYNNQQGRLFSNTREIIVTEKDKKEIKLDYKQVLFDEPQSFPFNIPKNYRVK